MLLMMMRMLINAVALLITESSNPLPPFPRPQPPVSPQSHPRGPGAGLWGHHLGALGHQGPRFQVGLYPAKPGTPPESFPTVGSVARVQREGKDGHLVLI